MLTGGCVVRAAVLSLANAWLMRREAQDRGSADSASDTDRLWSVEEVSRFLGIPVATLYRWRYLGVGPMAGRVGRHLRYLPADVLSWFRKQRAA